MVLNKNETDKDSRVELSEDLLSIVTVFVARNNGLRAGKNRKKENKEKENKIQKTKVKNTKEEEKEKALKIKKIQIFPNQKEKKFSKSGWEQVDGLIILV